MHQTQDSRAENVLVLETVSRCCSFALVSSQHFYSRFAQVSCLITAMDTLKLGLSAVDEITPSITVRLCCQDQDCVEFISLSFRPSVNRLTSTARWRPTLSPKCEYKLG